MILPEDCGKNIYQLSPQLAFEAFEDGGLVLKLEQRSLTELNPTASSVLLLTDGSRSLAQVADELAAQYDISQDEARQDVSELYQQLLEQKILEPVSSPQEKDGLGMTEMTVTQYICNPDVVLREEDEDGGLLFNPDTNQVKVVNTTGLYIWQKFARACSAQEVVAGLQQEFEDVPADEVAADVQTFLDDMLQTGFIGVLESE
ncbi:MAG: PqqD family peptide modification chaperone [Anaerolineales bacterium]|jgi:hypothetical protein|nr:PqqD family peptide modification chaperone [Anaerolineales bacterium]